MILGTKIWWWRSGSTECTSPAAKLPNLWGAPEAAQHAQSACRGGPEPDLDTWGLAEDGTGPNPAV